MKVQTKAYGPVEVDERQQVRFPEGLYGFENLKDYVLLGAEEEPFYWLQSMDSAAIAFVVVDPFLFRPDYEIELNDEDMAGIQLKSPGNAVCFVILTVLPDGKPVTANLQGPVVINRENRLARQIILNDPRWKTKHNVQNELSALKAANSAKGPPC